MPVNRGIGGALLVVAVLAGVGCGGEGPTRSFPYVESIHLAARLEEAEVLSSTAPQIEWREIGFDRRLAVSVGAPSTLRWTGVPGGDGVLLSTGVAAAGLNSSDLIFADDLESGDRSSWTVSGDGAVARCELSMVIACRGMNGAWEELVRHPIAGDGAWAELRAPLDRCSESTALELRAEGAADDCARVTAVWGAPRIEARRIGTSAVGGLVLLISVDTLRPDRMELYEGPAATPHLARLARDGVVFDTVVAPSPWTIPSHASLFTSTLPHVHRTSGDSDIPRDLPTLAEVLRDAGWDTAGFVDTPWLGRYGFDRGFSTYDASAPPRPLPRWGVDVKAASLLRRLVKADGKGLFLFWHIMDVHGPYGATAPFAGTLRKALDPSVSAFPALGVLATLGYHEYLQLDRFRSVEDAIACYDESITMVDAAIGGVLEVLRGAGLYDQATVVVTSDHGESFLDHRVWIGHGLFLTDDEIRVPLVVKLPGNRGAGRRVSELARLVDVAPTILDELGLVPPPTFAGASLRAMVDGGAGQPARVAFGSSDNTGAHYVRTDSRKYITAFGRPRDVVVRRHLHPKGRSPLLDHLEAGAQLYDLVSDPREETNLWSVPDWQPELAELSRLASGASLSETVFAEEAKPLPLDEDVVERLRALGYLSADD